jgi:predicted dehydrogenase
VPEEIVTTYGAPDPSWDEDWRDLIACIEQGRSPEVGADEGLAVMRLVHDIYSLAAEPHSPTRLLSSAT